MLVLFGLKVEGKKHVFRARIKAAITSGKTRLSVQSYGAAMLETVDYLEEDTEEAAFCALHAWSALAHATVHSGVSSRSYCQSEGRGYW